MVDITKCENDFCPIKNACFRWVSESDSNYQSCSWFDYYFKNKECVYYISVDSKQFPDWKQLKQKAER